jgi:hypothetical protein
MMPPMSESFSRQTQVVESDADVRVYFGEATQAGCRVYADWRSAESTGVDPEAWIHGPESPYASTLQARYPLVRRPGGKPGPVEAWIDEPCFWTPAAPFVYRYEVRFPPPTAATTGLLGIRRLTAYRDHLQFDQKRWVLRGAIADLTADPPSALKAWHEAPLAVIVDSPSNELCEQASRIGVLLVAQVPPGVDIAKELSRLCRWPAVGVAILEAREVEDDVRSFAKNLLLGQSLPAEAAPEMAPWARLLFCEVGDPAAFARRVADCSRPIVAVRRLSDRSTPVEARAQCDRLQSDLAALGVQLAGYIV